MRVIFLLGTSSAVTKGEYASRNLQFCLLITVSSDVTSKISTSLTGTHETISSSSTTTTTAAVPGEIRVVPDDTLFPIDIEAVASCQ